jgi:hypothetical protein
MVMALPTHHPLDSWLACAGPMAAYQGSDLLHTDSSWMPGGLEQSWKSLVGVEALAHAVSSM